ncbi:MAG: fimbria/pilus periplasmic chaperone [Polaromonas sp.]|nr:fimbria/pilus periplasmic chaperone [Polaromonas sp.]
MSVTGGSRRVAAWSRLFSGRFVLLLGAALPLAGLLVPAAHAASLQVAPISLEFSPQEQAQSIWLSNTGTTPVRAQVRVLQWSQPEQADLLAPTRELVPSPPMVEIAPGEKQMIRIIRTQPGMPDSEKSFRLIVDELPGPSGAAAAPGGGLQFLLRYSVPVFVSVAAPVPASSKPTDVSGLSATLEGPPPVLAVANSGKQRIKISQLVYVDAQGQRTSLAPGLLGYVLSGQRMRWPLNLPAGQTLPAGGVFKAKFNADLEEQTLPLANSRP